MGTSPSKELGGAWRHMHARKACLGRGSRKCQGRRERRSPTSRRPGEVAKLLSRACRQQGTCGCSVASRARASRAAPPGRCRRLLHPPPQRPTCTCDILTPPTSLSIRAQL